MPDEHPLRIEKPTYTHDAMIDLILANPRITQAEVARHFGYTQSWVSQVLRADAVRERMAERRVELFGPMFQRLEERMEGLAHRSLDVLHERLEVERSPDVALKALEITTRAMGYGAKQAGASVNVQFVVAMPTKSASSEDWVAEHKPRLGRIDIDAVIDG